MYLRQWIKKYGPNQSSSYPFCCKRFEVVPCNIGKCPFAENSIVVFIIDLQPSFIKFEDSERQLKSSTTILEAENLT